MRYSKRHSTYGRVKVKTIQLFLGKYTVFAHHAVTPLRSYAVSFAFGEVSFLVNIYIILLYIIYYI